MMKVRRIRRGQGSGLGFLSSPLHGTRGGSGINYHGHRKSCTTLNAVVFLWARFLHIPSIRRRRRFLVTHKGAIPNATLMAISCFRCSLNTLQILVGLFPLGSKGPLNFARRSMQNKSIRPLTVRHPHTLQVSDGKSFLNLYKLYI